MKKGAIWGRKGKGKKKEEERGDRKEVSGCKMTSLGRKERWEING